MSRNRQTLIRILIDSDAVLQIGRMSDAEDRTQTRQMGLILEAVADLYRREPRKASAMVNEFLASRHRTSAVAAVA